MRENKFQSDLIEELEELFPGCVIIKNDATYIQGFPDILILWGRQWAALECKRSESAPVQPNQPYWVATLGNMSFAAFIYPENKEEVLYELQRALGS